MPNHRSMWVDGAPLAAYHSWISAVKFLIVARSIANQFTRMSSKAGTERCQPEQFVAVAPCEAFFQRTKNRWAAQIAILAERFPRFRKRVVRQTFLDGFNDISATAMGNDLIGFGVAQGEQVPHRFGRHFGDSAVKLVLQPAAGVDKADLLALFGPMQRAKVGSSPLTMGGRALPESRGGAITEQTGAHDHAGIVIQIKSGGAYFDGDRCDGGIRVRRKKAGSSVHGWYSGATTQASHVVEKRVAAQADLLREVA